MLVKSFIVMVGCLYCIGAVVRQSLIGQQHAAEEEAKRG